jgi:hypothetical protein
VNVVLKSAKSTFTASKEKMFQSELRLSRSLNTRSTRDKVARKAQPCKAECAGQPQIFRMPLVVVS